MVRMLCKELVHNENCVVQRSKISMDFNSRDLVLLLVLKQLL